jgi:glycosyltransferase involved in cell wall biosynthesis
MQDKPLVSIIIPTYNRAHLIGETIQSVIDQTYAHWELIIVDDGSEDNTKEVVNRFGDTRIKYLRVERCGSLGKLRNQGIRMSNGAYIALLDSDDLWVNEKLSFQMGLLHAHPEAVFILGNGIFFGDTEFVAPECEELFVGNIFSPLIFESRFVFLAPTFLFKREIMEQVGWMDESYRCASEMDFFLRMSKTHIGVFSNRKIARIRKHNQNTSKSIEYSFLSYRDSIQIARKLYQQKMISLKEHNRMISKYYYRMGLLGLQTNEQKVAFQSFLSYIRVIPLHWKGWVRLVQTGLLPLLPTSGKIQS